MGKRSSFPRNRHDAYDTPLDAVLPLVPLLPHGVKFFEPCAGRYALAEALESHGFVCAAARDTKPRDDRVKVGNAARLSINVHAPDAQISITNPPFTQAVLQSILLNLYWQRPLWLLLPADWKHTRQAAPFMPFCVRIASIGRIKWIAGTKSTGKENYAWYLFVAPTQLLVFHARRA